MPLPTRKLGQTGLTVTEVGFGGYRIAAENDTHREALTLALTQGINLIDTSSNYTNGRSETLIGDVLQTLFADGTLTRDDLVVVSKAGYLQGDNYDLSQQHKAAGRPFPDLVPYADGLEHCIHPDFIADQLTRSLERLQLDTLDVYLLHNPEYYLSWAHKNGVDLATARAEYLRRIVLAFVHLEHEVSNGRIRYYGISSNTFPHPKDDPEFTDLTQIWEMVQQMRSDHHFRVIQLPMNLLEPAAATEPNQRNGRTVLDFAADVGLGVLINRPLNAIQGDTLLRLADVALPAYPTSAREVSTAVDTSLSLERHFQASLLPLLALDEETSHHLLQLLAIGRMLDGHWRGFGSYSNWLGVQAQFLLPRTQSGLDFLSNHENLPPEVAAWLETYVAKVNELFAALGAFYQEMSHKEATAIRETAVAANPAWEADTLSQTAVRALRSTRGVTSVLVGMRHPTYVADMLAELETAVTSSDQREVWQALRNGRKP